MKKNRSEEEQLRGLFAEAYSKETPGEDFTDKVMEASGRRQDVSAGRRVVSGAGGSGVVSEAGRLDGDAARRVSAGRWMVSEAGRKPDGAARFVSRLAAIVTSPLVLLVVVMACLFLFREEIIRVIMNVWGQMQAATNISLQPDFFLLAVFGIVAGGSLVLWMALVESDRKAIDLDDIRRHLK